MDVNFLLETRLSFPLYVACLQIVCWGVTQPVPHTHSSQQVKRARGGFRGFGNQGRASPWAWPISLWMWTVDTMWPQPRGETRGETLA